jgi:hypothetical protein
LVEALDAFVELSLITHPDGLKNFAKHYRSKLAIFSFDFRPILDSNSGRAAIRSCQRHLKFWDKKKIGKTVFRAKHALSVVEGTPRFREIRKTLRAWRDNFFSTSIWSINY